MPKEYAQTNTQTVHVYTSRASVTDHGEAVDEWTVNATLRCHEVQFSEALWMTGCRAVKNWKQSVCHCLFSPPGLLLGRPGTAMFCRCYFYRATLC